MKSMITKGVAFFLVGLLVMQVVFTGASKKANASHSESATIRFTNMAIRTSYTSANKSLPAPYNTKTYSLLHAIAIKDSSKGYYEPSYCIGYDKHANTNDGLSSKQTDAGALMTNEQAMLINYAIMLGFNREKIDVNSSNVNDTNDYFATQTLVWIIKDGYYYKDAERKAIADNFAKRWPATKDKYNTLYNAVSAQVQVPSFVNGQENVMKWNESTQRFEITLTNTKSQSNVSAMKTAKVVTGSLPQGVEAKIEGEKLIITSKNEITTAFKVKLVKNIEKKGRVVAWKNTAGDKQPQVTIDYDQEAIPQEFEVPVKTDKKPVVATPAPTVTPTITPTQAPVTVAPTETPVTVAPTETPVATPEATAQVQQPENKEVFETKEVTGEETGKAEVTEKLDESPKTADESNLVLAYKLIGASLFTMVALYVVSLINKRKQRF